MAGKSACPAVGDKPLGCLAWLLPSHGRQPWAGMRRPSGTAETWRWVVYATIQTLSEVLTFPHSRASAG